MLMLLISHKSTFLSNDGSKCVDGDIHPTAVETLLDVNLIIAQEEKSEV